MIDGVDFMVALVVLRSRQCSAPDSGSLYRAVAG